MQDREKQFKELFLSEYGRMYKAAYILLEMPYRMSSPDCGTVPPHYAKSLRERSC